jgi:hypothetical protein
MSLLLPQSAFSAGRIHEGQFTEVAGNDELLDKGNAVVGLSTILNLDADSAL